MKVSPGSSLGMKVQRLPLCPSHSVFAPFMACLHTLCTQPLCLAFVPFMPSLCAHPLHHSHPVFVPFAPFVPSLYTLPICLAFVTFAPSLCALHVLFCNHLLHSLCPAFVPFAPCCFSLCMQQSSFCVPTTTGARI